MSAPTMATAAASTVCQHEAVVARMSAWALSRFAVRCFKEKSHAPELWKAIANRASSMDLGSFTPADLSHLVHSFAQLRFRDRRMLDVFAQEACVLLPRFKADDLSFFLTSYAKLDVYKPLLLRIASREVSRRSHELSSRQLAQILSFFAHFKYTNPKMLEVIRQRLVTINWSMQEDVNQLNNTNPGLQIQDRLRNKNQGWDLVTVFKSLAYLRWRDDDLLAVLNRQIYRNLPFMEPKALALAVHSYAKLQVANAFALQVLSDEVYRKRNEFDPHSSALLLHGLNKLQNLFTQKQNQLALTGESDLDTQNRAGDIESNMKMIFDHFNESITRKIPPQRTQWPIHSLCLILTSFARRYDSEVEPLFKRIGDVLALHGPALYPQAVVMTAWSFAQQGMSHGVFFYNAPSLVKEKAAEFSIDQLSVVSHSYGLLNMAHITLFDTVTEELLKRLPAPAGCDGLNSGLEGKESSQQLVGSGSPQLLVNRNSSVSMRTNSIVTRESEKNLSEISDEVEERVSSEQLPCRMSSLVNFLEAYVRVSIYEPKVFDRIVHCMESYQQDQLTPKVCSKALQYLAEAHHTVTEKFLRLVHDRVDPEYFQEKLVLHGGENEQRIAVNLQRGSTQGILEGMSPGVLEGLHGDKGMSSGMPEGLSLEGMSSDEISDLAEQGLDLSGLMNQSPNVSELEKILAEKAKLAKPRTRADFSEDGELRRDV